METRDPDDALTLYLLATHPRLHLAAVTVNPGPPQQIAVVREILGRLECSVPIDAGTGTFITVALAPARAEAALFAKKACTP